MAAMSHSKDLFPVESVDALSAGALGFMPRLLVLTTLPHRRPTSHRFERVNGQHSLRMSSPRRIGLPYGSYPRLILIYLTTAAVRSKSREIELGRSPNDFARRLGLTPISGKRGTVYRLQDQLERLFTTRLNWRFSKDSSSHESGHGLIITGDTGLQFLRRVLPRKPATWRPKVVLSRAIFQGITRSSVPIDLRAVHQLKHSPLAIDIYIWLTHRMSYLRRPSLIPWKALQNQFGADYGRLSDFRRKFLLSLRLVLGIYDVARVSSRDQGLVLLRSPTHLPSISGQVPAGPPPYGFQPKDAVIDRSLD